MSNERKIIILSVLAAGLFLLTGWLFLQRGEEGDRFAQCRSTNVAGGMEAFGAPFTLTNQDGERVTDQQVFTKPSILYFGYTYCPDVCPLDTARNASAVELLKQQGYDAQGVFLSVDPARDTPEVVKDFTQSISPDLIGLTGTREETDGVSKGWRNYYKLQNEDDPEYYLVDHLTHSYLVLPNVGTVEFFDRAMTPDDMAQRTACFLDAASS